MHQLHNPFLTHLGVQFVDWRQGCAVFEMRFGDIHTNPAGRLHGGVMATLLDVACGYAGLFNQDPKVTMRALTLGLTLNFVRSAKGPSVRAIGELAGGGREIFFSTGKLLDSEGNLVATCQGNFKRIILSDTPR